MVGCTCYGRRDANCSAVLDDTTGRPRIWTFNSNSPVPTSNFQVNSIFGWVTFDISADGSIAVFSNAQRIVVVDLNTGQEIQQIYIAGMPNFGAVAVGADNQYIFFGTKEKAIVYSRGTSGLYTIEGTHPLATNEYVTSADISDDGKTLGIGINMYGNLPYARIKKLSRSNLNVLVDYTVPSGSGILQNQVWRLAISDDGDVLAAGLWGDGGTSPELIVFKGSNSTPSFEYSFPGSTLQIDISPDGSMLAVASKGVHATIAGGGGAHSLFQIAPRDLSIKGVPEIGSTFVVTHSSSPGGQSLVLVSTKLASEPTDLGSFGTLYLDLNFMTLLGPTATIGSDGTARHVVTLPNNQSLVGSSLYYQGIDLGQLRKLSENWIKMTVLPN